MIFRPSYVPDNGSMIRKLPRSKDIQLVIFLYISWVWQIHNWLNICNLWTKFHTYKSILFSRHIEWICTKECRPMRTDKWWYTQLFTWPWCSSLKLRHATVYPFIQMNFTLVILQYIVLDVNDIGFEIHALHTMNPRVDLNPQSSNYN